MDDPGELDRTKIRGVVLCSGKIYYELAERQRKEGVEHVAVVRVEQLYPFPGAQILEAIGSYPNAGEVRWVQEEPENMGAYRFVHRRLAPQLPEALAFSHVAREESGSPATGSATVHQREQQALLRAAFEGL